jgi:hypothetical protein
MVSGTFKEDRTTGVIDLRVILARIIRIAAALLFLRRRVKSRRVFCVRA